MGTANTIREHIEKLPQGEPFTASSMLSFGSRAAVDQALSRLAREGAIARITRGVYVRPEVSKYVGTVLPEPLKVVQVMAHEHGEVVQVHGAEAARRMALSTQVPTKSVFLTSGPNRHFRIGKLEVVLKNVSARKLALAERPAGVALTALWYLGKEQVTSEVVRTIETRLAPEEFTALCAAKSQMPAWMADTIRAYEMKHGARAHG
ncbi:MAG: type IV toxin-antitoxin system AbiEi family antitoxin domain-containing protein [Deltaproteobacteria bacterium]|nr:type IV toxin-antitoxin system AbiEi family antitoxin domain-containing protein [Deltaproteobacteria bacterium]